MATRTHILWLYHLCILLKSRATKWWVVRLYAVCKRSARFRRSRSCHCAVSMKNSVMSGLNPTTRIAHRTYISSFFSTACQSLSQCFRCLAYRWGSCSTVPVAWKDVRGRFALEGVTRGQSVAIGSVSSYICVLWWVRGPFWLIPVGLVIS